MGGVESAYNECCGPRPSTWGKNGQAPLSYAASQPASQGYAQAVGTVPALVGEPAPEPTGRRRALLVGCNYPGSSAELNGCINDVLRMSSLLRRRFGFSPYEIRMLTDDGNSPHGYSTRNMILDGMRWLVQDAQPGDALFFHYSGHGGQQLDPNYAEEDGYDETILPTDFQMAGMIVDDEAFDHLCTPLPSGCKLTAVMDCCHSGTGLDLPFVWQHGQWVEEDNPCHSAGDVLLVSGCLDEQTSADATGGRGEAAGALTTALVDSLEECPLGVGEPSVAQLLEATRAKLQQRGFDQVPNLTASQRFNVGSRTFSATEGFESNQNPSLGRHFRKSKHPKMDYGEAFNELLSAAGTAAAFAPLVTGLFGQHAAGPAPAAAEQQGCWEQAQQAPLDGFGQGLEPVPETRAVGSDEGLQGWGQEEMEEDYYEDADDGGWDD